MKEQVVASLVQLQSTTLVVAGMLIAVAAFATAISFSLLGGRLLDNIARQPEATGVLTVRFFIIGGLVDAFAAIAVSVGLYLIFAQSDVVAVLKQAFNALN